MAAELEEIRPPILPSAMPDGSVAHDDAHLPRKRLLGALISVNVVAIVVAVVVLWHLYEQTLRDAEVHGQNIALAVDLNLSNEFNKIDLSLRTVVAQLNRGAPPSSSRADRVALQAQIEQQHSLLPEAEAWSVTDREGNVVAHDGDTPARFSIADREYFLDLKSGKRKGLLIYGPLTSRLSGQPILMLARSFHSSDGAFAGIVSVPLPLAYLERELGGFGIGPNGALTLRNADLEFITRVPAPTVERVSGNDDAKILPQLKRFVADGKTQAVFHAVSRFDNVERIYSFRRLSNAPVHMVAGISRDDALEGWRQATWSLAGLLGFFLLIVNGAAVLVYRQWQRQRRDALSLAQSHERLQRMAFYDELTGLPNRALLSERVRQAMVECRRKGRLRLAVCCLDLDGFKEINDRWGHVVGDQLLVEVALRLRHCIRANDTVARLGGDEFVVLFSDLDDEVGACEAVSRLIRIVSEPCTIGTARLKIALSVGVTLYPSGTTDEPDALLRQADQAMYEAKRNGKNRMQFFDLESERFLRERQAHYDRLVEALQQGEFRLHYQPKVALRSGQVIGVEALLRWQHPQRGLLLPSDFLSVIESSELTLPVGEWIIHEALQQHQRWCAQGVSMRISVNLFSAHLQRPDFVEKLRGILEVHPGFDPAMLELEVVETTALEDIGEIAARIHACMELGVNFALDDFGTGYSSLTYLRELPARQVKIDRSFVCDMLENTNDRALVESIVGMAHTLGRQVVAEGVETLAHGEPLIRCRCDYAQGYGIGRPMPAEDFPGWLSTWRMPLAWAEAVKHDVIFFGAGLS